MGTVFSLYLLRKRLFMKRYILLRDNRESGPYLLWELKSLGLTSTDLIWVEGESTSWGYASDMNELKAIAERGITTPLHSTPTTAQQNEYGPLSGAPSSAAFRAPENTFESVSTEELSASYLNDKDDHFHWGAKKSKRRTQDISISFFGLGVLLVGAMLCAFVVKKLVDHFEFQPYVASAQAIEISRETLPVSTSSDAAKAIMPSPVAAASLTTATPIIDSIVAAAPAISRPIKNKQEKKDVVAAKADETLTKETAPNTASAEVKEEATAKPEETKEKELVVEKKAPSLGISANDYKVGVFGGISNLELSINNPSSTPIDKATVEVEFLKPNGSVVKSEILSVENISAGGVKRIAVPASSRGVKIRYRIVNVNVHEG